MSKTAPIKPFNGKPTSSLQGTDISPAQAYKMTNYNERLDAALALLYGRGFTNGAQITHRKDWIEYEKLSMKEAKQAIIKLIEDEVREAVWKEKERIYEFATRKQANGLYVPIELGIEPWLREQL